MRPGITTTSPGPVPASSALARDPVKPCTGARSIPTSSGRATTGSGARIRGSVPSPAAIRRAARTARSVSGWPCARRSSWLLAESLPGGLVLAFAVLFVLGGAVSFVSSIRDYTFTSALGSIAARFDPDEAAALDLGPAIAVALAWVVVLMVPGVVRFLRSDFR
jgi:hypothetical protein